MGRMYFCAASGPRCVDRIWFKTNVVVGCVDQVLPRGSRSHGVHSILIAILDERDLSPGVTIRCAHAVSMAYAAYVFLSEEDRRSYTKTPFCRLERRRTRANPSLI